jgi:uncharacterized protein YbjT (DUF2867 family)
MSIITVLGATGSQGGSVCNALQGNPHWKVRAVTRNPASNASKKLLEKVSRSKYGKHSKIFTDDILIQGIEVVAADANDEASLHEAFRVQDGQTANPFEPRLIKVYIGYNGCFCSYKL